MENISQKNIIHIKESGNRLSYSENYTPIVCGNSNYYLKFEFEGDWLKCTRKTAIFIVDGKKFALDFEGDTAPVPAIPNSTHCHVALTSSYDQHTILNTTAIKLRLEPSPLADDMSEFDPISGYLSKMLGIINKFEDGNIEIENVKHATNADFAEFSKSAESATNAVNATFADSAQTASSAEYAVTAGSSETQVDLSSDQTIGGVKNFVNGIKVNGKDVEVDFYKDNIQSLNQKINKTDQMYIIYDKASPDPQINLGYTAGVQGGVVLYANYANYKYLKIYAYLNYCSLICFVPFNYSPTSYYGNALGYSGTESPKGIGVMVNTTKTALTVNFMGTLESTAISGSYIITKIEGVK